MKIMPVILCGGSGTRLWPESRKKRPKQFIPFFEDKSLFELTLERVKDKKIFKKPLIITSKDYSFFINEVLEKINLKSQIIYEPMPKNTTAPIFFAAKISKSDDNLLIMPSDHLIENSQYFTDQLSQINEEKLKHYWLTFGIKPTFPSQGYGYIQANKIIDSENIMKVSKFIEKPNFNKAEKLFKTENIFWNSGIFMGNSKMILDSILENSNNIFNVCQKVYESSNIDRSKSEIFFDQKLFSEIPSESIDYAVMEKTNNILMCPIKCNWSDVGTWDAVSNYKNSSVIKENVLEFNSKNNFVRNENRIIATIGIEDTIIIDSDNSTLICKKGLSEDVKEIVEKLKTNNSPEGENHTYEFRPWGKFENLLDTSICKVKRILVKPKHRLSLQFHNFRSEHWLVVSGKAKVYLDGSIKELKKGQSIDIPTKSKHYVQNDTSKELIIIETQLGTYFGEDDIIRLDDPYKR